MQMQLKILVNKSIKNYFLLFISWKILLILIIYVLDYNEIHDYDDEFWEQGCDETLLNSTIDESITLAPGENQKPIPLLFDKYAEELSFPTIFCGQMRDLKVKMSYDDIMKSALRNYKRKCARVDHLFFMYKKLELIRLSQRISICLRKKVQKNNNITAGMVF